MSCVSYDVLRVFEAEEVATNFSEAEALLLKLTRRSLRNDAANVIFIFFFLSGNKLYQCPSLPNVVTFILNSLFWFEVSLNRSRVDTCLINS
jgi:hypothetical protein